MKILLTGSDGQLGHAVRHQVPAGVELIATSRRELDLADADACRAAVLNHRPDWVLNAGAYTAVDKAESEPELTLAVNGGAPRAFAEALLETGGRLLQLSTDFVFNGQQGTPYRPEQSRDPLGVYGATKAKGEEAVEQLLAVRGQGVILRTSWVMGPVGKNFALTMLRLHREREQIDVVADQVGCPTSTASLAAACWRVIAAMDTPAGPPAVLHWSDAGAASWYDVAMAVGELGLELGLLERMAAVNPITTADYPTPAERPSYSLLDCTVSRKALDLSPTHWRQTLRQLLEVVQ
ncbi:dTDP-4-dehydrorhamnose reductase [Synechococcus sp. CBW1006]|uniref:dTDP-4-dehydrorhamnose reductase n=1 Tax=Synechococcus sp. CBW1006 TaxID=1353138 RepID=UPI0018CD8D14|nr:dTDP-4-dehydrorhamnose reductase [Synechococcus sp. CBW1006]QPN65871.1 dTDP-4-dehydrorhamnose reductase [Synechococcus sp. CBW1006]